MSKTTSKSKTTTKAATASVEKKATSDVDVALLLKTIQDMQSELEALKGASAPVQESVTLTHHENSDMSDLKDIVKTMANAKSNKEVTIVHGQEMLGGLTTHINLANLTIDFRHVGEQRVLSWQQFEELVSKYPTFIKEGIILLAPEHLDLCEKYEIKCYQPEKSTVLTATALKNSGDLSTRELEEFYNSLDEDNRKILMSYWLGKCYEIDPDPKFYDRYKLDLFNRLSNSFAFGNIITDMNNKEMKERVSSN